MNFKDLQYAIEKAVKKGLSDDLHMIVAGSQLNKVTGTNKFDESAIYEIKDGNISKLVENLE